MIGGYLILRACELGHANGALHHVLSREVSSIHPGAQEHISQLGAYSSLVLAVAGLSSAWTTPYA